MSAVFNCISQNVVIKQKLCRNFAQS